MLPPIGMIYSYVKNDLNTQLHKQPIRRIPPIILLHHHFININGFVHTYESVLCVTLLHGVTVQSVSIQLDGRIGRLESLLDDGLWRGDYAIWHNFSVWVMRLFCKNLRHIHNNQLFGNNHHTMIDSTIYFWSLYIKKLWWELADKKERQSYWKLYNLESTCCLDICFPCIILW